MLEQAATHLPQSTHFDLSIIIDLLLLSIYSVLSGTTNGVAAFAFVFITNFNNSQFSLLGHEPHLNSCLFNNADTLVFTLSCTFSVSVFRILTRAGLVI